VDTTVTIVGGGLAGCEAAWQLADRGLEVNLYEMRPDEQTGAHTGDRLGEVVCSNSFKSTLTETASGLLKAEMDIYGNRLLPVARESSVPAGHALAIDRELFAETVTRAIQNHPRINLVRQRVDSLDLPAPAIIATGPLTGDALAEALRDHCGENLYFYDAIAPSIDGDSIDPEAGYRASRYDKGGADYLNIPLDREQYRRLLDNIRESEKVATHPFEEEKYFESCLPIEVIASRGDDTLRYGPLKPRGLSDPRTGREPYAVIQLRQESREGNLLGLVGFQTRMTWPSQKQLLREIPGFENVHVLRYGTIHRNIYLDIPRLCTRYLADKNIPGLYFAGQICGVEGYVESIASAQVAALAVYARSLGEVLPPIPHDTMIGALMNYVHEPSGNFQPMNANMGLLPPLAAGAPRGKGSRKARRQARNEALSRQAIRSARRWREENSRLF
jgi:methylenetetrahydrofolate--tRNA-(uracil-5-)-methyltransferase